jgi:hypothetical protein
MSPCRRKRHPQRFVRPFGDFVWPKRTRRARRFVVPQRTRRDARIARREDLHRARFRAKPKSGSESRFPPFLSARGLLPMHDFELHQFKTDINLVQYAIDRYGYQRDRRESSRASHVLRRAATNDKIIVRRAPDGHWTYFSVRDDRDHGTIIDFVQARGRHDSLGHVREELRQWLGTARPWRDSPCPARRPDPPTLTRSRRPSRAASRADNCPYLNARGIRPETLRHPRFAGRWGLGPHGNALFVHTTEAGEVTGYEIKNRGFTGFATGGTKSAWQSAAQPTDGTLVLTESAIDALSYFQLHPDPIGRTRFLSTGGAPSTRQIELLGPRLRAIAHRAAASWPPSIPMTRGSSSRAGSKTSPASASLSHLSVTRRRRRRTGTKSFNRSSAPTSARSHTSDRARPSIAADEAARSPSRSRGCNPRHSPDPFLTPGDPHDRPSRR